MSIPGAKYSVYTQVALAATTGIYAVYQLAQVAFHQHTHIPAKKLHIANVVFGCIFLNLNIIRCSIDFCGVFLFYCCALPCIAAAIFTVLYFGVPTTANSDSCANLLAVVTALVGVPILIEKMANYTADVTHELIQEKRSDIIQGLLIVVAVCYSVFVFVLGSLPKKMAPTQNTTHLLILVFVGVMLLLTIIKFWVDLICTKYVFCVVPIVFLFVALYILGVVYFKHMLALTTLTSIANFLSMLCVFIGYPAVFDALKKARSNLPVPAVPELEMVNLGNIIEGIVGV